MEVTPEMTTEQFSRLSLSYTINPFSQTQQDLQLKAEIKQFLAKHPQHLNTIFQVDSLASDPRRGTLLQHAVYYCKPITVRYLLKHGPDLSVKFADADKGKNFLGVGPNGLTAKEMARKYKYEDIVKLVEYQEVLAKPVHSWTPGEVAAWAGRHVGARAGLFRESHTSGEGLVQFVHMLAVLGFTESECHKLKEQFYRLPSLSDCQPRRFQTELVLEGSLFPKENYLKFIPQAKGDFESIVCSLEEYSKGDPVLYPSLMDQLRIRFECLSKKNISLKSAQARALIWAYTSPCWIYQEVNQKLQGDSPKLELLGPFIKGLMECWDVLDPSFYYSGVVCCFGNLKEEVLNDCSINKKFIWTQFVSASELPVDSQGATLLKIHIPLKFKRCALKIWSFSRKPLEREVLILPNVSYIIKKKTLSAQQTEIELEVVDLYC